MASAATWTINQQGLLLVVVGIFGLYGFRRGVRRELVILGALVVGAALIGLFSDSLAGLANRAWELLRFALAGGFGADGPNAAWGQSGQASALVASEGSHTVFKLAVFGLAGLTGHLVGRRRMAGPGGALDRILGLPIGLLSGVVAVYSLMPVILPGPTATIQVMSGDVQQTLESGTLRLALLGVLAIVLIVLAMHNASGRAAGTGQG